MTQTFDEPPLHDSLPDATGPAGDPRHPALSSPHNQTWDDNKTTEQATPLANEPTRFDASPDLKQPMPAVEKSVPDILSRIKCMYRFLDVVSEQGTGGIVDKIVIDEAGLKAFVNSVHRGAYKSISSVDFTALDAHRLELAGIYGSKCEIARFLAANGYADEATAALLKQPFDPEAPPQTQPILRSGLYLLVDGPNHPGVRRTYVIFWPEDSTWTNHASSSTKKNRIAFMRYLTKLADQLLVLISRNDAKSIDWKEPPTESDYDYVDAIGEGDSDSDDIFSSDRIFDFEVEKTAEEEEDVKIRSGFEIKHPSIMLPTENGGEEGLPTPHPLLVPGELTQAFLTAKRQPAATATTPFNENLTALALQQIIGIARNIRVGPDVTESGLNILVQNGLRQKVPDAYYTWTRARNTARAAYERNCSKAIYSIQQQLESEREELHGIIYPQLVDHIVSEYPDSLTARLIALFEREMQLSNAHDLWHCLCKRYSECQNPKLIKKKARLFAAAKVLQAHPELAILEGEKQANNGVFLPDQGRGMFSATWNWIQGVDSARDEVKSAIKGGEKIKDLDFLAMLHDLAANPLFTEHATVFMAEVTRALKEKADHVVKDIIARKISAAQQKALIECSSKELGDQLETKLISLRDQFVEAVSVAPAPKGSNGPALTLTSVERISSHSSQRPWRTNGTGSAFQVSGNRISETQPSICYTIHPLRLTEDDKHATQLDRAHIPRPVFNSRFKQSFSLPLGLSIKYIQLLTNDKCFMVVASSDLLMIYLEPLSRLDAAVSNNRFKTKIHLEKLGKNYVLTFDESKRAMAILAMAHGNYTLHLYELDENMASIRGAAGSPINLTPWFADSPKSIQSICFVGSSDLLAPELCVVDNANLVRIFSTATAQFRGATVTLIHEPLVVGTSPDGSCLCTVAMDPNDVNSLLLETYHWASFGDAAGRVLKLASAHNVTTASLSFTAFVERSNVHLLMLDPSSSSCRSVALDITKRATEYAFRAQGNARLAVDASSALSTNQLIECLSDVWTRFPVAPAIGRATITTGRTPPSITFVTDRDHERYLGHFLDTVRSFEQTTRKPTGNRLSSIAIGAISFARIHQVALHRGVLSQLCAGEWLIEAICLIPIQIAVTRENRFVPLKDGVCSSDLERSLLGASVNLVASHLTLGWYESIFSYAPYVHRPVKVVSSMGEQSVGKSFSMNHLLDTSFAGSAMRCTEGVWMSCTPTSDALIVALDFEGVQSIERSAQEDSFLVLFNTAISNMILFRNNFALSRDIAGLFTSFQKASTILDPAMNTALFQSRLVIIIKDVIENDRVDMVKEFQLKFAKIVAEEQAQNFISKAHRGKTTIIPWPVIESRQFYELFVQVKKVLAKQKISHPTAGGFLLTLKTLMAKIKTHDWGALNQNLASQRIEQLQQQLVPAIVYGLGAPPPDDFPLKNLDDDTDVPHDDSTDVFYFTGISLGLSEDFKDHQIKLDALRLSAHLQSQRQTVPDIDWLDLASAHIQAQLDRRIRHVTDWITLNTTRFANNTETLKLRRLLDAAIVEVQAGIEFCGMSCLDCSLNCVLPKRHEGDHDCKTSHQCKFRCEVVEDDGHDNEELCGLPAGHSGTHLCEVAVHHCGEPCAAIGQPGCLKACSKNFHHDGNEHLCAGRHACGLPCDMNDFDVPGGESFNAMVDDEHIQHACESRVCPLHCILCQRPCIGTHFHGQDAQAVHLCDQEHACKSQCVANGVCEISTVPHTIETTFTGRHEVFMFTKYSQDARRLPCEIRIPSGEMAHSGPHVHTTDPSVAHYCDQRCPMCEYLCTLPYGHAQKEHDTSHGSMSKTQWALDGAEDAALEISGHRFASNDSGAPMLCSTVCDAQGRHVHIDYCRAAPGARCVGTDHEHLTKNIMPHPDRPKDVISHAAFWERAGEKDRLLLDEMLNT
ncbi:hypothetical protein BKA62DRAFT_689459 [Auriculariales sp. MPI-PUGE-AT-0066]|nr:hypothetical protein BKA62DRAFT_689459 [Auriculariales sp. MPI-PUGE-AT-0066]